MHGVLFAFLQRLRGVALAVFTLLMGTVSGQACQYCRLAATDPEAARMAAQMHAGGFPLDATINQFQPLAAPAVLAAPPAPGSVATNAADLPAASRLPVPPQPTPATISAKPVPSAPIVRPAPFATLSWADAGLLGLLGLGGWFCWRTRRVSAPVP